MRRKLSHVLQQSCLVIRNGIYSINHQVMKHGLPVRQGTLEKNTSGMICPEHIWGRFSSQAGGTIIPYNSPTTDSVQQKIQNSRKLMHVTKAQPLSSDFSQLRQGIICQVKLHLLRLCRALHWGIAVENQGNWWYKHNYGLNGEENFQKQKRQRNAQAGRGFTLQLSFC